MDEYPEEMTLEQCDAIQWDYVEDHEELDGARADAMKRSGRIYTQVDGEHDRVYLLGIHHVNRTGRYLVVRRKE